MHHAVVARTSTFLDQRISRGQVVSVHKDIFGSRKNADKLNQRERASCSDPVFVPVHSKSSLRKGMIDEDLIDQWERTVHEENAKGLMSAILSDELTGKHDHRADDAGYHLEQLGLSLEELRERYEQQVREDHAELQLRMQTMAHQRARGFERQKSVEALQNEITYAVPAVRGVQAKKEFYLAQIPYGVLARMFVFDEEVVPAELRAQRALNTKRSQAISDYMLANPEDYVLPSLTASVDKAMAFQPIEGAEQLGTLHIPMDATMLINDGQHRRHAIEICLKADMGFTTETAPVQIHFDQGLKRSQQMFADINSKQVKPSSALNSLYDHRNPFNAWVLDILAQMPDVKRRIDFENSSPGARSYKLWSLIAFKRFVTLLTGINDRTIGLQDNSSLTALMSLVQRFIQDCNHIPYWAEMMKASIPACDVREQFVIGHAVFLEALGIFGRVALFKGPYLAPIDRDAKVIDPSRAIWDVMSKLAEVDPNKAGDMWQNRCVVLGKMQKTSDGTKSTAAQLLRVASVELPKELAEVDARLEPAVA